jgi:hypothetical protein
MIARPDPLFRPLGQEALDLDILVDLWPVNADAIADQFPLRTLLEHQTLHLEMPVLDA